VNFICRYEIKEKPRTTEAHNAGAASPTGEASPTKCHDLGPRQHQCYDQVLDE
jgi:hypothetical protein